MTIISYKSHSLSEKLNIIHVNNNDYIYQILSDIHKNSDNVQFKNSLNLSMFENCPIIDNCPIMDNDRSYNDINIKGDSLNEIIAFKIINNNNNKINDIIGDHFQDFTNIKLLKRILLLSIKWNIIFINDIDNLLLKNDQLLLFDYLDSTNCCCQSIIVKIPITNKYYNLIIKKKISIRKK